MTQTHDDAPRPAVPVDGSSPTGIWPELSVVVPMYNEADNVATFYERTRAVLGATGAALDRPLAVRRGMRAARVKRSGRALRSGGGRQEGNKDNRRHGGLLWLGRTSA